MQMPSLLPSHLHRFAVYNTDRELFQALTGQVDDLHSFLESACIEEDWTLQHSLFMRLVLRWVTRQFYLESLPLSLVCRFVKTIQRHYDLLRPLLFFRAALFFTLKIKLTNQTVLVNSLLFGAGSPVLRKIFKYDCFEKLRDTYNLPQLDRRTFQFLEGYFYRGKVTSLEKENKQQIASLMHQAQAWEVEDLVRECTSLLQAKDLET